MLAPAVARWPALRAGRGHYESFYVRAFDPHRHRGLWIRYTVSVAPGEPPAGRLWCVLFDRDRPTPVALRSDAEPVTAGGGSRMTVGTSTFDDRSSVGGLTTAGGSADWSLRWADGAPPLLHLPRSFYATTLPRTKLLSLTPSTVFDGRLGIVGEEIAVDGWPGMVGHNWGAEHAASWMWLHGLGFAGAGPDTWLDLALARIRIGPLLTPWSASGAVCLGGRRVALGGPGRRVAVHEETNGSRIRVSARGLQVTVDVSAPPGSFASWDYAAPDPGRPPRDVQNRSVADVTLEVEPGGGRRSAWWPRRPASTSAAGSARTGADRPARGNPVAADSPPASRWAG